MKEFTKQPFIIDSELRVAIVDKRVTYDMERELNKRNIEIIKSIGCRETYESIKYHPDICVCNLGNKDIIVAPNVYEEYKVILSNYGMNVIKGKSYIENKYPKNVQYNIAILKDYAIHNFEYTDETILEYLDKKNIKKVNVKQGYSKCSICIVDEKSIITSDIGIYNATQDVDIDCLLIEQGYIELMGMDYGFIGGCTGLISQDKVAFLGDVSKHPNYKEIKTFIEKRHKEVISLSKEPLLDLGSIVPIMVEKRR